MTVDREALFGALTKRYSGATPEALMAVMCPLLIGLHSLDKKVLKLEGQKHFRASFQVRITAENEAVIQIGRTGKFVPSSYLSGGGWNEIAKGRIVAINQATQIAEGEVYVGESGKGPLVEALNNLEADCLWEVDQYGASAKILSALAEHFLVEHGRSRGYKVVRMPEDMARHLGGYANFDFTFEKNGRTLGVEAKSLWGTNTDFARLIHSTTTAPKGDPASWTRAQKKTYYPTSSCKFATQDIFAVNLFLRTGNIEGFAFAVSIPADVSRHGLPRATNYSEHVGQNPRCNVDNVVWFGDINEIWDLAFELRPSAAHLEAQVENALQDIVQNTEPEDEISLD